MKRTVVFLVIFGLATMFVSAQKRETRQVSGFTGIDASSVFDITVSKGATESLVIEADDNVMQYVRSEVRNGVLHLYLDRAADRNLRNIRTLKASVVMKDLDKVSLSGVSKLTTNDLFTPNSFTGNCSGVSNLTVNVNTGTLNIEASGVSKIQLKANVTGDAKLSVSGTSNTQAELKAQNVRSNSSGTSKIDLTGSATDIRIEVSGTSKFQAENFTVKNATVNSSGAGNVTIHVTDNLTVNSSGASNVNYKGSPVINFNSSGAAKIRSIN